MSNEREALVETLWLRDGQHRDHREEQADAVIQYLWNRADDPEVVGAAVGAAFSVGFRATDDEAAYMAMRILTALLGPRPSGEDADDE